MSWIKGVKRVIVVVTINIKQHLAVHMLVIKITNRSQHVHLTLYKNEGAITLAYSGEERVDLI